MVFGQRTTNFDCKYPHIFFILLSREFSQSDICFFLFPACHSALGLEDGRITDRQLWASSTLKKTSHRVGFSSGRLNGNSAWCSQVSCYITVDVVITYINTEFLCYFLLVSFFAFLESGLSWDFCLTISCWSVVECCPVTVIASIYKNFIFSPSIAF